MYCYLYKAIHLIIYGKCYVSIQAVYLLLFSSVLCTKNKYEGKIRDTDILSFSCINVWGKKQLGKGRETGREGGEGGGGEPVDKHPEATFPPSCNYPADHLSVGKIVICQLISRVSNSCEN